MPPIDLLAGIPSIVYGFFGMIVIVPLIRNVFGEADAETVYLPHRYFWE